MADTTKWCEEHQTPADDPYCETVHYWRLWEARYTAEAEGYGPR